MEETVVVDGMSGWRWGRNMSRVRRVLAEALVIGYAKTFGGFDTQDTQGKESRLSIICVDDWRFGISMKVFEVIVSLIRRYVSRLLFSTAPNTQTYIEVHHDILCIVLTLQFFSLLT